MRLNRLLTAMTLALAALPAVAHAQYLTPEDVLLRDRNALYVPTTRRAAEAAAEEQQARSAAQDRPTVVDWWDRPAEEVAAEPEDDATYSGPPLGSSFSDDETVIEEDTSADEGEFDPVTLRWLRRLQQQQGELREGPPQTDTPGWGLLLGPDGSLTPIQGLNGMNPPAYHSGADLTNSGPASTAAIVVMLGAVGWTLYRSKRRKLYLA